MNFNFLGLGLSCIITPEKLEDRRGYFARVYCSEAFESHGLCTNWVQSNISLSKKQFTLRGLHLQNVPFEETKLVRCTSGSIFDVIVDLRAHSPTYGKYRSCILDASTAKMMYVPAGFAHGFMTLSSTAEITYLVSQQYSKVSEQTLLWSDKELAIQWPAIPSEISDKDQAGSPLSSFNPINVP